jgi:hypothetical protein
MPPIDRPVTVQHEIGEECTLPGSREDDPATRRCRQAEAAEQADMQRLSETVGP